MNTQKWDQAKLLELSGYYWQICTLHTAVELDIFSLLADRRLSSIEIARAIKGSERGVSMLLDALVAMRLLTKSEGTYFNAKESRMLLSGDSDAYIGFIIKHHYHSMASWVKLKNAVIRGKPVRTRAAFRDKELQENFLMGMFNLAMVVAPRLVPLIDTSRRRHVLDLGGGPGTYAIHFCLKNPALRATVFDLPSSRRFAQRTIARFHLEKRVHFIGGDFLKDAIKGSYDIVWLSHILHAEGPHNCVYLVKKALSVLEPGGMIIIHDFILNNTMDGPLFPALFSLNMLLGTQKGQSYSEQQIKDMLAREGVRHVQRIAFRSFNDSAVITGIK